MNKTLPAGWVATSIEKICIIQTGKWNANHSIKNGKYRFYTCAFEFQFCNTKNFSGDCIIIPGNGANVGTVFFYSGEFDAYQRTYVLSNFKIDSKFSYFHMLHNWKEVNKEKQFGSATNFIRIGNFLEYSIAFPPLEEQKRIVERLDKIIPRIDAVKSRLEKIPSLIKRFRQSILNAAVTGKLTEKWREEHPDVESAEILLEKIKRAREIKHEFECEKVQKEKKFNFEINNSKADIPTWKWDYLGNIAKISGGVTKGRNLSKNKTLLLPYLRVANVQDGYLNLSEIKLIEIKTDEINKYRLQYGDILFTEGGDRDKLGRGCVWENEIKDCLHQNHIFKARVNKELIAPQYISLVTKSDFSKKYFDAVANQTVNLASINMTNLKNLPLPLPPIEEQEEIVRQVDKYFALADTLEIHYKNAKEKVDKLTQSVLAKAFRGELVTPEAILAEKEGRNFESAEQLLERIINEKNNK